MEIKKEYVKSTAKCSCSLYSDYKYHTHYFKNYCPNCHRYGTINYEQGSGGHNPEGMWYCTACDMDFCLVHGKSHDHRGLFLEEINASDRFSKNKDSENFPDKLIYKKKLNWQNIGGNEHFKIDNKDLPQLKNLLLKSNSTRII
ncbi:MAG: hypothetical protein ACP5C3_04095 [Methanomicrobiales archaeon]